MPHIRRCLRAVVWAQGKRDIIVGWWGDEPSGYSSRYRNLDSVFLGPAIGVAYFDWGIAGFEFRPLYIWFFSGGPVYDYSREIGSGRIVANGGSCHANTWNETVGNSNRSSRYPLPLLTTSCSTSLAPD